MRTPGRDLLQNQGQVKDNPSLRFGRKQLLLNLFALLHKNLFIEKFAEKFHYNMLFNPKRSFIQIFYQD